MLVLMESEMLGTGCLMNRLKRNGEEKNLKVVTELTQRIKPKPTKRSIRKSIRVGKEKTKKEMVKRVGIKDEIRKT